MEIFGLILLPLIVALFAVRKPRDGIAYLIPVGAVTVANGIATKYFELSPDGGAPERAWAPAVFMFIGIWVAICILVAMGLRVTSHTEAGTGLSPGD